MLGVRFLFFRPNRGYLKMVRTRIESNVRFIWLSLLAILYVSSVQVGQVRASEKEKLFMNEKDRYTIHAARQVFLKKASPEIPKQQAKKTPYKSKLPYKIMVSSIIITPDNRKIIRVNNAYQQINLNSTTIDFHKTTLNSVVYKIDNKPVVIPVGKTFFPHKNKLVNNNVVEKLEQYKVLK